MFRFALPILLSALMMSLSGAAFAAAPKKEEKSDAGQYVDLQTIPLPIVSKGAVVNYVFVYLRINLSSAANAAKLREMEPVFRDAVVRAAHREPFTLASDLTKIDERRLIATLTREANTIAGPGQIRSVALTSQAPRRRAALSPG